jgi:hypothetical protein
MANQGCAIGNRRGLFTHGSNAEAGDSPLVSGTIDEGMANSVELPDAFPIMQYMDNWPRQIRSPSSEVSSAKRWRVELGCSFYGDRKEAAVRPSGATPRAMGGVTRRSFFG